MKKNIEEKNSTEDKVIDFTKERIKKNIADQTDPDCKDAVEDFLKKFKNDTLTGF